MRKKSKKLDKDKECDLKELECIVELTSINLEKDSHLIFRDVASYFGKFFRGTESEYTKSCARLVILNHLRKLPIYFDKIDFKTAYRANDRFRKYYDFLIYYRSVLELVVKEQEDSFLDAYSSNDISKDGFQKIMSLYGSKKEIMKKDLKDLTEIMEEYKAHENEFR